ncbi:MAG: M20 metallopeptidase family protein [Desulfomonilia bacterium]
MMSYTVLDAQSARLRDEVIRLRRDFHSHPELGFEEKRTSSIIAEYLRGLGIEVKTGIGKTGVVGLLKGAMPGRTLMLRADMDALPIQELNKVDYCSVNPDVMHACGHDGHVAILLGTARLLSTLRDSLKGRIKFVFQPAEENLGGARAMIEEGVLENPKVDAAFGLHLISLLPYGYIGCGKGPFMASMDTFTVRVLGRSGHSAMPDGSIDAIALAAGVISDMGAYIKRALKPENPVIVNIGTVHGGAAPNIVADKVELTGTVRALDEDIRSSIKGLMERFLRETTGAGQGEFELDYEPEYPVTVNDGTMADLVLRTASAIAGSGNVIEMPPSMASEDMSFYLKEIPGCFFFVGAGGTDPALNRPHHNPFFTIDERSLEMGLKMMAGIAVEYLETA